MTTGVPTSTAPRRPARPRTFVPLGIAAWLVLEIWLLGLVSEAVGGLTVVALLAGGFVLGAVVIKRAGRRAFKNMTNTFQQAQEAARTGRPPAAPPAAAKGSGNGMTMLAGLLLIMPGLLSDVLGLLLLLPPVRALVSRRTERALQKKMASAPAGSFGDAFQQARIRYPDGKVVQGEVIREDRPDQAGTHPDSGPRPPLTP
ncbi:FxsA family membrane protein [Streptomyces sp. NPDC051211]|uniref:FxsA family membrane protein n=1 Tax=Streptomyces sp. NPDC051211 TaxID=3154643 RepID=UPI00344C81F2